MMSTQTVSSQPVHTFIKVASDYCTFLEDHCAYSSKQFSAQCKDFLTAIDQSILQLPSFEDMDTIAIKVELGPTGWITRNITEKLGDQDRYATAGESGAVSDDLTKIYRYLKQGLLIYNSDPTSAVTHWKSHFTTDCQPDLQRVLAGL